jgi:hypothetical protein
MKMEETIKSICDRMRQDLKAIEVRARGIKEHGDFTGAEVYKGQHGEMIAQSMLAVRALEEARMRLGKVLQYAGDGVSIYDKA